MNLYIFRKSIYRSSKVWIMRTLVLSILVMCAMCSQCLYGDDSHEEEVSLIVDGLKRTYLIHVPGTDTKKEFPLVLMLHGAGGSADHVAQRYGWREKADKESFIVVFPQALPIDPYKAPRFATNPNIWNDGSNRTRQEQHDDIAYLRAVIQDVVKKNSIDQDAIFCTGFSNGASMCFLAGVELSDIISAIAPVAGHLWLKKPKPKRLISMMLITGSEDPLNPLNGGPSKSLWGNANAEKPPMIDSVNAWLRFLGIPDTQKKETKDGDVLTTLYGPNAKGLEVVYVVIDGQGHEWPGSERTLPKVITGNNDTTFNATDAIWNFFKEQK
jgi:polyhydroxybutyrate depolymerase